MLYPLCLLNDRRHTLLQALLDEDDGFVISDLYLLEVDPCPECSEHKAVDCGAYDHSHDADDEERGREGKQCESMYDHAVGRCFHR